MNTALADIPGDLAAEAAGASVGSADPVPAAFRAIPHLAVRRTSLASMGVDVADVNRDGYYDLFVSDMLSRDRKLRMTQFAHVPPPVCDLSWLFVPGTPRAQRIACVLRSCRKTFR